MQILCSWNLSLLYSKYDVALQCIIAGNKSFLQSKHSPALQCVIAVILVAKQLKTYYCYALLQGMDELTPMGSADVVEATPDDV